MMYRLFQNKISIYKVLKKYKSSYQYWPSLRSWSSGTQAAFQNGPKAALIQLTSPLSAPGKVSVTHLQIRRKTLGQVPPPARTASGRMDSLTPHELNLVLMSIFRVSIHLGGVGGRAGLKCREQTASGGVTTKSKIREK